MKKILSLLVMMTFTAALFSHEKIDLSSFSYTELLELKIELDKAIEDRKSGKTPEVSAAAEKAPADKYTQYVKNYVGKNLSNVGYTSFGGERLDSYGSQTVELTIVSQDGSYIDIGNEDELKKYRVVDQSIAPDSKIVYKYTTSSGGYESCSYRSLREIDLFVKRVDGTAPANPIVTAISKLPVSDNKNRAYVKNYVGKNFYNCGYTSFGEDRLDYYSTETIKLIPVLDNGAALNVKDEYQLKKYYVASQDVKAGTPVNFEFREDRWGIHKESQSITEITLYLKPLSK